jgi:hypothetical protein
MLPDLSTFSQSTSQKAKTNPICITGRGSQSWHLRSVCTSNIPPTKKQSHEQNSITHTIHKHSFLCSFGSAQTMEPKTNQQIATNSNSFPTNLQCHQIICSHLKKHRSSKKTQITLKTRKMWISLHISYAVDMDTKTHKSHGDHHRSAKCIKTQKPIDGNGVCSKPRGQGNHNRRPLKKNLIKNKKTKKGARSQALNSYNSTPTCTKPSTHLACQCTSQKGRKKSSQVHFFCSFFEKKSAKNSGKMKNK